LFIRRSLEKTLLNLGSKYSIVLVAGARQVGKSTLLRHAVPDAEYVTLDDPEDRLQAQREPKLFLSRFKGPTIIDEVQYAPELFPLLKVRVDETQRRGQFWLSGSQQFHTMRNVSESLAGRVAILGLAGLSTRELLGEPAALPLEQRLSTPVGALPVGDMFERIWRGSYPALHDGRGLIPEEFYPTYVQTYLQRTYAILRALATKAPSSCSCSWWQHGRVNCSTSTKSRKKPTFPGPRCATGYPSCRLRASLSSSIRITPTVSAVW
jgi:predicted AAA+ superfamily ATPase